MSRTLPTTFGKPQWGLAPKGFVDDTDERMIEDALPPYHTDASIEDFVPIYDQVVIERFKTTQIGRFVVPERSRAEHRFARVIHVGPGRKHPLSVQPGDMVLLPRDIRRESERIVFAGGHEYTVIRESYIMGVVEE